MKRYIYCFLLILVACGGGGSGSPATTSPQPAPPSSGFPGNFGVLGHVDIQGSHSAHISVHGSYAYMGTNPGNKGTQSNRVLVWDISDPSTPFITATVETEGNAVNDVMIRADGGLAAYTDGAWVGILDLADPAAPIEISKVSLMDSHNLWIEGDFIYAAEGRPGGSLVVIDIRDPMIPQIVASYFAGVGNAHDVHVRNGIAVVSHFAGGVVILDIGGGGAGGSPANPIELSRIETPARLTHNAWYWPAAGYIFAADEVQGADSVNGGSIYVFDVQDLRNPIQVAVASVSPEDNPHNFWVDEQREILYVAWRGNGIQAFDVSGTLSGQLELQGRHVAGVKMVEGPACMSGGDTCTYSLEGHNGLIYVSDKNSGLWVLEPQF